MQIARLRELDKQWQIRVVCVLIMVAIVMTFSITGNESSASEPTTVAPPNTLLPPLSPTNSMSATTQIEEKSDTTTTTVIQTTATTLPEIVLDPINFEPISNPTCELSYSTAIDYNTLVRRVPTDAQLLAAEIQKFTPNESLRSWIQERISTETLEATNTEFASKVLRQILRREPTEQQIQSWAAKLDSETSRIEVMIEMLEEHPYQKDSSPFCNFVNSRGGGKNTASGIVYQQQGIEHIVFVDLHKVVNTHATGAEVGYQLTPEFAAQNDLTVAINANWFTENNQLDGYVVSEGTTYGGNYPGTKQQGDHDYTALFGFDEDHKIHTQWHGYTPGQPDTNIVTAVSGHPSLTHKGELASTYGFALGDESLDDYTLVQPNAHSAIGVSQGGRVLIFAAVDGKAGEGYSAMQMAEMMQRVGAYESTMLDGGGSTSLVVNGVEVTNSNKGRKVLANIGVQTGSWFE